MKFLFAALALAMPIHAAPPAPTAAPAARNDAAGLAELLMPERAMLDLVVVAMRSQAAKSAQFGGDPALAAFVVERLRPEIEKVVRESLPELRAEIARIIAADMTPAEINDVYTFFTTPTGQRLQQTAFDVIAENPMADPATQQKLAVDRFLPTLTPSDYPPLTAFGASAGAKKMQTVTPKTSAASAAWADRLLAKHGSRFDTLRADAVAEYKRRKGAGQ